jgi:ABC-type transport system involved in multi-copper enzyme maturation permease subunit
MKNRPLPKTLPVVFAIAKITASEILRDRILYNVIFCAAILLCMSYFASHLMILHPERVLINFGVAAVAISCGLIGIFTGASVMPKEISRRTIYVSLCHPISTLQFVIGKFTGLSFVILINCLLLIGAFCAILHSTTELVLITPTLLTACGLFLLQALILGCLSFFFSLITTTSLGVICVLGIFMIGSNISSLIYFSHQAQNTRLQNLFEVISWIIPRFENFNLSSKVTYNLPISFLSALELWAYGLSMLAVYLFASTLALMNKDL